MAVAVSPYIVHTLRTRRGWTQEDLAAQCSVSVKTIQRVEKTGICSLDTRSALLAAFDIDLEQIQGESVIDQAGPIKTDEKPGLFYNRSHSGGDLVKIFLNTHAYRLTHDEPLPGDVDFIADSLQTIFDWAEIWGDIAIGSQVKATHSMTLMIKEAEERGLRVFGLRTFDKVNSFHICNIHIAYKTNAAAVVLSPND